MSNYTVPNDLFWRANAGINSIINFTGKGESMSNQLGDTVRPRPHRIC